VGADDLQNLDTGIGYTVDYQVRIEDNVAIYSSLGWYPSAFGVAKKKNIEPVDG